MILQRIRNLWALSNRMHVKEDEDGKKTVVLENVSVTVARPVPKGSASIVDIISPIDEDFPEEKDI